MDLKEAEKITSDFIKTMEPVFDFLEKDKIYPDFEKVELEAIETVLQALEKLQEENEKLKTKNRTQKELTELAREVTTEQVVSTIEEFEKDYISKDKIKEKIVDLKVSQENTENDNLDRKYQYQIDVLDELLKGE